MQRTPSIAPSSSPRPRNVGAIIAPLRASLLSLALLFVFVLAHPSVAYAQSRANEGAARALEKKAMEDDYLNTDFDKAAEKLNQAIAKCGTDKCGVPVRGQLRRDLAAVQSAAGHKDLALAAMTEAFKIDAGLQLDPNFKTKDLEAVYNEAKKAAAGAGASGPPPAGDFTHTPVTEQQVRTPIPIYAEYTGSETLKRVLAKYKGLGMTEWKTVELKPIGSGFGATTPCADVQTGDFVYYIQGFNEQNDPVATSGDRNNPYRVTVKSETVSDPPHLPGQSPPSQCAEKGDCPPDFPGCKKGAPVVDKSLKGADLACEEDSECQSSNCKDLKCTAPPEDASSGSRKKFWIGVAASIDFSILSSGKDVCVLNSNGTGPLTSPKYYCTHNGSDFPPQTANGATENAAIKQGQFDSVGGGLQPGDVRLIASFDYAFTTNQMAGIRAGYVARTYPGSLGPHFPPLHVEGRYSYVFGDDPIGKAGIHPMILAGLGVSEFDSSVNVSVVEGPFATSTSSCPAPQTGHCVVAASAWQTGGPFFLEVGGGARWEFVPGVAMMLDLKLVGAIGSSGFKFIPTPELALQFGF